MNGCARSKLKNSEYLFSIIANTNKDKFFKKISAMIYMIKLKNRKKY